MARANGRSQQRSTQTKHHQPPQASQRTRRGAAEEPVEDEDGEENDDSDEEDAGGGPGEEAQDELVRKANALVRLALFNEHKRMPLRRDEINKKVLGQSTRAFNIVFSLAQVILQKTFGMEMSELHSKTTRERGQNDNGETRNGENATGLKKKATSTGVKSYILRSTLHPDLIEVAAATDEQILEQEILDIPDDEDEDANPGTYGSILCWSSADDLASTGLFYVILALVMLSGGVLSNMDLKKHLKSLRLSPSAQVYLSARDTRKSVTIEVYLAHLVRQGYLDKIRVGPHGGPPQATQGKRSRGAGAVDDEGTNFEWSWGSRAQAEIGEEEMAHFVGQFIVERMMAAQNGAGDSDDDADADERGNRRGGAPSSRNRRRKLSADDQEKMLDAVMKGIIKAAGLKSHGES